ncbi:MAG: hypothetical protein C0613_02280 [Desulfobulbaceae bacterium]|nr:MAG: hypothetical protein C0613_02280 [Desulfobulbaceae bacterium]
MQERRKSRCLICLPLLFWALISAVPGHAGQDLTANWSHGDGKDEVATDDYFITYTLDLKQEVTEAMSLHEALRYSTSWREERDSQSLDPSLRFAVTNDLFLFELFGAASRQRNSESADQKRANWEASWTSAWQKRFWPTLRATYGEDWQEDDNSPKITDKETKNETVALEWDLELLKAYYNYSRSRFFDNAGDRQNENTNNFAKLEAAHTFWQNRLNLGFSHQYSETRDISTTNLVGTATSALVKQGLAQVLHGLDSTPLTTTSGELTSEAALHDGDLETASALVTNGIDTPPHTVAVKVDFKKIDRLYLYSLDDEAAAAAGFTFAFYTSDNGTDWQLQTTSLPFTYNSTEKRFEFVVPGTASQWLKLVVTSSPLATVEFSEIEAYQLVTGINEAELTSTSSSMITDVNVGARLTEALFMTYNLSFEDGEYGSGVDYDRFSQAGQLRWQAMTDLSASLAVNESKSRNGDADQSTTRSYSINMNSVPLETVDVNMGMSRSENYRGGDRQSVSHIVGLYTTAALYPDLDGSLDVNYSHKKDDETELTSKNYHTVLSLTARLVPGLTADLTTDYQHSLGDEGAESTGANLSLNWRSSEMLSINMSANKQWQGSESQSEGAALSLSLAPTATTQFSLSYNYAMTEERINRYAAFGSWSLGPHFTLQGTGSYAESQGMEEWRIQSQLVARFSVM